MKKGIVIGTSEYTKDFLRPCLKSIEGAPYPVLVVSNGDYQPEQFIFKGIPERNKVYNFISVTRQNPEVGFIINDKNGWEPAVLQRGKENFDEFVHLMDSTVVKDVSLFDKLFAIEGNVVLTKGNFHYMGKFVSKDLPNLPLVRDKQMAVYFESRWLPKPYAEFEPDLPVHANAFETIHGQYRMRLENEYLIKWKGTWVESPEHPIPK